jgi:hypothetical protein
MNLVFSYSPEEDHKLAEAGFTFLGASYDNKKGEVHVFQLMSLEECQADEGDKELDRLTDKADQLVKHSITFGVPPIPSHLRLVIA